MSNLFDRLAVSICIAFKIERKRTGNLLLAHRGRWTCEEPFVIGNKKGEGKALG